MNFETDSFNKKVCSSLVRWIIIYVVGYIACKTLFAKDAPFEPYMGSWFRHDTARLVSVAFISLLFIIFKKYITGIIIAVGCFLGMILGEIIGNYIKEAQINANSFYAYKHYGVIPIGLLYFCFIV